VAPCLRLRASGNDRCALPAPDTSFHAASVVFARVVQHRLDKAEDWLCYGVDVLAVASGKVVEAMRDLPDVPPGIAPTSLPDHSQLNKSAIVILYTVVGSYAQ
jgi:hypothetical protein